MTETRAPLGREQAAWITLEDEALVGRDGGANRLAISIVVAGEGER